MLQLKNRHEAFIFIAAHLLKQGKRSVGVGASDGVCSYRGAEDSTCAIGCIIDDQNYYPKLEGNSLPTKNDGKSTLASDQLLELLRMQHGDWVTKKKALNMLRELQNMHDCHAVADWGFFLNQMAFDFKIKGYTPVEVPA